MPTSRGTRAAARESFPDGIDLVIDDATHCYPAARDAFEALFPLVRVGGTYVIENWAWAHRPAAQQVAHSGWRQSAVTNFVFELSILAVTAPVIDSIHVEEGLVAVRKGPGHLPAGGIADALALRGRELATI